MVTIKDVAVLAGVAPSTVSRVINNSSSVKISERTRQRVLKAVKDSGYRANRAARALVRKKSGIIGFASHLIEGPFFASMLQELSRSIAEKNYRMMFEYNAVDPDAELQAIHRLLDENCEAVLVYSRQLTEEQARSLVDSARVPVIFLNRRFLSLPLHCLSINNVRAAYEAVTFLIDQGHHQIACICGHDGFESGRERLQGYKQALSDHGLTYRDELVFRGDYTFEAGIQGIEQLARGHFTALFAASSHHALGATSKLISLGYQLPRQVSVIGFDDVPEMSYTSPSLTTVRIHIDQLAKSAVNRALALTQHSSSRTLDSLDFRGHLVIRDSVCPPNNAS